ncbi:MAG: ankyrin repeat domain-containing protein [Kiritimatiellaeota bacterium]|nr:ankyrin repeat domain-containing protein [Kiritimatiellota bacterium]
MTTPRHSFSLMSAWPRFMGGPRTPCAGDAARSAASTLFQPLENQTPVFSKDWKISRENFRASENFTPLFPSLGKTMVSIFQVLENAWQIIRTKTAIPIVMACFAGCSNRTDRLLTACGKGETNEVRQLLSHGADPRAASRPKGWTALHVAAARGQVEVVKILLNAGVSVNEGAILNGMEGAPPIFFAAMYGYTNVVEVLIEHGADLTARYDGKTPLEFAELYRMEETATFIRQRLKDKK